MPFRPVGVPQRRPRLVRAFVALTNTAVMTVGLAGFVSVTPASADPATGPDLVAATTPGPIAASIVPEGTCRASIVGLGGAGASSGTSTSAGGIGAAGAKISATFGVMPGQAVVASVGGGGQATTGGVGGGGRSGTIVDDHRGGGGGGRTAVAIGGTMLLVAGGGGGGGAAHNAPPNGNGGRAGTTVGAGVVATGANGTNGVDNPGSITVGSGRGGQTATGGAGGVNSSNAALNGTAGGNVAALGIGGNGGPDSNYDSAGGGGAGYTGGGGGSSTANSSVTGAGGGGGSSFVAGTSPTASATVPTGIAGTAGTTTAQGLAVGANGTLDIDWLPCLYNLALTKSVATSPVIAGGTVVWTVTVRNNGPDPMTKGDTIDLTDTLPVGPNGPASPSFEVLSVDVSGGSSADMASGAFTCSGVTVGSAMPASTSCSRAYSAPGAPGAPTGGLRGLNVNETLTITYEQQISLTASCPATITNTATVRDRSTETATGDITGVVTTDTAARPLTINCVPVTKLRLVKALSAPRHSNTDQFTMAITPSGVAPSGSSVTTTGTGSTVTAGTGIVDVATATPGLSYTFSEAMTAGSASALSQYRPSVTCSNAASGSSTVLPTAGSAVVPYVIVPALGDDITCTISNAALASALTIAKSTTAINYSVLGASIPYSFLVTNTGATTLTSVTIADPKATGISCPVTTLSPGGSTTCTASHTVTQADLDATSVVNTATVTGTPPGGSPIPQVSSNTVTVPSVQSPAITISKSTTKTSYSTVGESIPYSFTVTNTGNVTLTTIAVSDPKTSGVSCAATSLAPGQNTTCTGTHTVVQADLNAGSVINTASVVATPPSGTPLAPASSNTITVPAVQSPALTIVKSTPTTSYSTIGQTITYSFAVRNSGNVTMTAISVSDPNATGITCLATTLTPGATTTCSGTHTVTAADLNAGSIVNTASVVGTPPSGPPIGPVSSNTITVPAVQNPQLTIVKSTTSTAYSVLGATIPYSFTVTNTGNVTLTGVSVSDAKLTGVTCVATTLAAGLSTTCSGTHTVSQADLDSGSVVNTASVTATPPSGVALSPILSNTVTVPATQNPQISIAKSTTKASYSTVGETIPYSFAVTNTGNVTLNTILVSDPKTTGVSCPGGTLAPGASTTCTGSHTVTQADLDAASVVNTATVDAKGPSGASIPTASSNTVTVPSAPAPLLTIMKSADKVSFAGSGETITYSFGVTNAGNVTMTAISVSDPQTTGVTCAATTLAPGASTTCTGTHVTTATDVSNEEVVNTAAVVGTPPIGAPTAPTASNTVTVPLDSRPGLTIVKSTPTTSYSTVGTVISYSFTVTNTGNVALGSLVVTDPKTAGVTCAANTLAIAASTACSATHTVTQADLDAGSIVNTASAAATPAGGSPLPPTPSNTITIPAAQTVSLTIVKSTTTTSVNTLGATIPYVFRVTNTGNVTMTAVSVSDANATGINCPTGPLAPGTSKDCTGTHTVTQADLDAGAIVNSASTTGTPPSGPPITPVGSNIVTVPVTQSATLTITKASTTANFTAAGQQVPYTFVVRNSGNVTMTAIAVTDPKATGISCPSATLAAGASMMCTATHVTTQADMNAGSVVNTAAVTGTPPSGTPIAPIASNTVTVPGVQTPGLAVVKATTTPSFATVGQVIPYTFTVTNTGNVTLSGVTVTDPLTSGVTCVPTAIDPGEVATCTGSHTATQADLDAGSIVNRASVTATPPSGPGLPPVNSNIVTVPAVQSPGLTIVKSTVAPSFATVGQVIPYRFEVTNVGNVNLTGVAVTDTVTGPVTCSPTSLSPGQSVTCTADRTTTQADLDAGSILNTASVVGTPPSGPPIAPVGSNTVTVPAVQRPSLSIVKATTTVNYNAIGNTIPYGFTVTNTGNVTLHGVTVNDPKVVSISCPTAVLAPGASTVCTGSHVVTQADLDNGSVVNTAAVTGTPPSGTPIAPVPSNTVTVPAVQTSTLTVTKATTAGPFSAAGDRLEYTLTVTNTGNVTMRSINVVDPKVAAVSCPSATLAPGASTICTGTRVVTQADLDAGSVVNTATVSGTPPSGIPTVPVDSNTVTLPAIQGPALSIVKSTTATSFTAVNETVNYSFGVTNTGNVTMYAVAVSDPQLVGVSCASSVLAPGSSTTCTGTHLATAADINAGSIVNTATVVGTPPSGTPIAPVASNTVTVPATQAPALSIVKATATASFVAVGDTITYTFRVVNTGNVTLTALAVVDPQLAGVTCAATSLANGAATNCTGTRTVVLADLDAGSVVNTASVVGTPPSGPPVAPVPSNTVTVPAIQAPAITVVKSTTATTYAAVGDQVAYSFTVSNTGNVTLTGVEVTDPKTAGVTCPSTTLAALSSMICTGSHAVTLADLNAGFVANTAAVSGTPPSGPPLGPIDSNTVTVNATITPGLSVVKAESGAPSTKAGDVITYTATVTNTGNVSMSLIKVDDPKAPDLSCPVTELDPAASTLCTGTHLVTQADVDAGVVTNTAYVTGKPPVGTPVPPIPSNTVNVVILPDPKLTLSKATSLASYDTIGQTIVYTFEVTNTGNVTMSGIGVSDPKVSGLSCLVSTLAPGATTACVGTHAVTQTDIDAGSVVNTAAVVGTPPIGPAIMPVPSNTVTVPSVQTPAFTVDKATTTVSVALLGEMIPYTFTVTNTGNVTLTAVAVTDPNATGITCPSGPLQPSQSTACTGTHAVTQIDLDAGSVINVAQAVATPPSGTPFAPVSSNAVTVPVIQGPALTIVKSAVVSGYTAVGDLVGYTFTVRNTGNVSMTAISVTDPIAAPITCLATALLPGVTITCTGSHAVTQADLDAGSIVNTASVAGTPPTGGPIPPVFSNTITVNAVQNPSLTVSKATTKVSVNTLGENVPYTFMVTNTGNVTLTAVAVTDPKLTGVTCLPTTLAPSAVATCSGSHLVTQAELDAGVVTNTATATGTPPSGTPLVPVTSNTVNVPVLQAPSLSVTKSTTASSVTIVGQTVPYTFTVRNTGNVTVTGVAVSDPNTTGVTCPTTSLAPGQQTLCTGSHTVTQGDIDSGAIVNTASVVGVGPAGPLVPVPSNTVTLPVTQNGIITIVKAADVATFSKIGDVVHFTFTVTNTGNVTLSSVSVTDPKVSTPVCAVNTLAPGASTTCTASRTVTQDDLNAGSIINTAQVGAKLPNGASVPPVSSNTVRVDAVQSPALTIVKSTAVKEFSLAGESITYGFVVTNTGNVMVTDIKVNDPIVAPVVCEKAVLQPGEQMNCTATYTTTGADVSRGKIDNVASVTALPPSGPRTTPISSNTVTIGLKKEVVPVVPVVIPVVVQVTPNSPTTTLPATTTTTTAVPVAATTAAPVVSKAPTAAAISLDKKATNRYSAVGDKILYTFVVANTGSASLEEIRLTDTMAGLSEVSCPDFGGQLAPGASITCGATYAVTIDDIRRGHIENTAKVAGRTPDCPTCEPVVAVLGQDVARSVVEQPTQLPFTGAQSRTLGFLAVSLMVFGSALVTATRRRRRGTL